LLLYLKELEELEKQAAGRLPTWGLKNLVARVAPINNTKVLGPMRKHLADMMNRQTGHAMRNGVDAYGQIGTSIAQSRLTDTAMQSVKRTPLSDTVENLKYKVWDGARYSGKVTPMTGTTAFSFIGSEYKPNPGVNFTDPMWYFKKFRQLKKYPQ